jgi:hypothetical protein
MKRTQRFNLLLIVLFFLGSNSSLFSQTLKSVFTDSEVPLTYLGIDFTKNHLLDIGNPDDIRNRIYGSINELIANEPKKFDLAGAFSKSNVPHDFSAVTKNNAKININDILSTNSADFNRLKEADINSVVKALDISGKTGIGLLFVMEAMRKVDKKGDAAIWVTLVDMKTKKVLMTQRVESDTKGGFGFRNYWASTIKNLIDNIDKKLYKEWKSKYGN